MAPNARLNGSCGANNSRSFFEIENGGLLSQDLIETDLHTEAERESLTSPDAGPWNNRISVNRPSSDLAMFWENSVPRMSDFQMPTIIRMRLNPVQFTIRSDFNEQVFEPYCRSDSDTTVTLIAPFGQNCRIFVRMDRDTLHEQPRDSVFENHSNDISHGYGNDHDDNKENWEHHPERDDNVLDQGPVRTRPFQLTRMGNPNRLPTPRPRGPRGCNGRNGPSGQNGKKSNWQSSSVSCNNRYPQTDDKNKQNPKYKTQPCVNYPRGDCKYGDNCTFIHDPNEAPES